MKSAPLLLPKLLLIDLAVLGGFLFGGESPSGPRSPAVDERPALEIGAVQVSRYLVDKYHRRFVEGMRQQEHRTPSSAENRDWLDLFVAQQCVIVHLGNLGYLDRPEVVQNVARMERHMLTQAEGPFYQELLDQQPPPTEEILRLRYACLSGRIDGMVARFPDEAAAASALGADFDGCPVGEQTRRIQKSRGRDGVEISELAKPWPFEPVSEIGDVLCRAPRGCWIKHHEPGFGLYYLFTQGAAGVMGGGDFEKNGKDFAVYARQVDNQIFLRRRHNLLLASAGFALDEAVARNLADLCRNLRTSDEQIPEDTFRAFVAVPLFSFNLGSEIVKVPVSSVRTRFNGLFVRRVPRSVDDIRLLAENQTVEELDLQAARARGIDRTPQFIEDRKGYAGLLALDLFEREVLLPKVGISAGEIEQYYAAHRSEFLQTNRIRGRLLKFDRPEAASAWRQKQPGRSNTGPDEGAPAPLSDQEIDWARDETIPGLEMFQHFLFACPDGTAIGPVQQGGIFLCFLKQKNVETVPVPLVESQAAIRLRLERKALDARERSLAAELVPQLGVKNHVGYARYEMDGVAAAPTSNP